MTIFDPVILQTLVRTFLVFGGFTVAFTVFAILAIKGKARSKWWVEFNNNGILTFALAKPNSDGEIDYQGGVYYLPDKPRMQIGWPQGVPNWIQETVFHEKYVLGNPEPIEYDLEEFTGLAVYMHQTRAAETRAITQVQEGLAAFGGLRQPLLFIVGIGVIVAIAAGAIAAYYGYASQIELESIKATLRNI